MRKITAVLVFLVMFFSVVSTAEEKAKAEKAAPESTVVPVQHDGDKPETFIPSEHRRMTKIAKKGGVNILLLGDSLLAWWPADFPLFDKSIYGTAKDMKLENFAVQGDKTQHVLWRLQNGEIEGLNPKSIVLLIGTNNLPAGNTSEEIAAGITAIVKLLREKLPNTNILLLGLLPRGEKPSPLRDKIMEINKIIANLDDGKMVNFLDIGSKFVNADGTAKKELYYSDYLHFVKPGYEILAAEIQPQLVKMAGIKKLSKAGK